MSTKVSSRVNRIDGRKARSRAFAVRNGWPASLWRREVLVMNLMADGEPRTARQICDGIGVSWLPKMLRSRRPGGKTLGFLIQRSLLRSDGWMVNEIGSREYLYSLAPGIVRREVR